ncbi:DgyrCDS8462 [Dimorphilus gyrociliatus]|uniref:tRNA (adenine(58)-N(1))-methyltransferase non-catalytic subunit TRM6 n=1 Tax=Dimorphilus gyrociliatus TaxID=2664684 RepID=A0A7I8VV83_9ANNE|nr:DgyrCDS8462 [Dimorphilus gyrociliatus]
MSNDIIQLNDQVVVRRNEHLKIFRVRKNRTIIMGKIKFHLDNSIGKPYGSSFEVKNSHLVDHKSSSDSNSVNIPVKDNRNLRDSKLNQKLSREDIHSLKDEGCTGEEIIEKLIEHSSTFNEKTEYSQEKHNPIFTILKPCTRLIAEMYWNTGPQRLCNLRFDTLSQILAYGNVCANRKLLVVDSGVGLVSAAILERMQGKGSVIQLHDSSCPVKAATECYNFSKEIWDSLHCISLSELPEVLKFKPQDDPEDEEKIDNEDDTALSLAQPNKRKFSERVKKKEKKFGIVKDILADSNADGLIVASKFHPTPIVLNLIQFIAQNRPIVIFCQHIEPLLDCYNQLKSKGNVLMLKIFDIFLREHQVLQNRTHPHINMSNTGGYLLTGITVSSILVSPSTQATSGLENHFIANKTLIEDKLKEDQYSSLRNILKRKKLEYSIPLTSLDLEIANCLINLLYTYNELKSIEKGKNSSFEEILSPEQNLNFSRAFKIIFSFGLNPALEKEIVLWDADRLRLGLLPWNLRHLSKHQRFEQLLFFTHHLLSLAQWYKPYMISRSSLPVDIISSFLTLAFSSNCQPNDLKESRMVYFDQLQSLCNVGDFGGEATFTAIFLMKDIHISRPDNWFKRKINHFLLNSLLRKGGLASFLLLNDTTNYDDDKSEWRKAEISAKIVVECSKMASTQERFLKFICPQIIDIFLNPQYAKSPRIIFYCLSTIIHSLVAHNKHFTAILDNLFYPLFYYLNPPTVQDETRKPKGTDLVKCIELMHKIFIGFCDQPNEQMLRYLIPYMPLLFSILKDCKTTYTATRCRDIIVAYLMHHEKSEETFYKISSDQMKNDILLLRFSNKADGTVFVLENCEKLSDKHSVVVEAFTSILSSTPKQSKILSRIFLLLINKLDEIIKDETVIANNIPVEKGNVEEPLMEIEKKLLYIEERNDKKIFVMKSLERLCQMSPIVLLENVSNLIRFIALTLKRAAILLEDITDSEVIEFQIINVNMIADMLLFLLETNSDEVFQLKAENVDELSSLLPALSKLEMIYGDSEAAEKLLNLRIAIATRGKVMNDKSSDEYEIVPPTSSNVIDEELKAITAPFLSRLESLSANTVHNGIISIPEEIEQEEINESFHKVIKDISDPLIPVKGHALIVLKKLIYSRDEETMREQDLVVQTVRKLLENEDSYVYSAAIHCLQALAYQNGNIMIPILLDEYSNAKHLAIKVRLKLGESLQKIICDLFEMLPKYKDSILSVLIDVLSEESDILKVSGLSMLGDCCRILKYNIGIYLSRILTIVENLLNLDKSILVKRASAMFIEFYLRGFSTDMMAEYASELKSLYKVIKLGLSNEIDDLVIHHLSAAKENLDELMKLFFQPAQNLEKTIFVADSAPDPFKDAFL